MDTSGNVIVALALTLLAGLSTGIGSAIAYFIRRPKIVYLAFSLGLSAGAMVSVSLVELLPKASDIIGHATGVLVFFMGILFIGIVDLLVPEIENPHHYGEIEEATASHHDERRLMRAGVMTAVAIGIHNLPEGLATFASADRLGTGICRERPGAIRFREVGFPPGPSVVTMFSVVLVVCAAVKRLVGLTTGLPQKARSDHPMNRFTFDDPASSRYMAISASTCLVRCKAIICDSSSVAAILQPSCSASRKSVVLRHIGFDIQQRCAVENIHTANGQSVVLDTEKSHTRQPNRIRAARHTRGEQPALNFVPERDDSQTWGGRTVEPVEQPDSLEAVQVLEAVGILREELDDSFPSFSKGWLNRGPACGRERGMNDSNRLEVNHDRLLLPSRRCV